MSGPSGTDGGDEDRHEGTPGEDEDWDDPIPDRIEPGQPSAENVAFVLLGALGALFVIARIAGLV